MSCSAGCMWNRYVFTEEDTLFGVFVVGVVLGFYWSVLEADWPMLEADWSMLEADWLITVMCQNKMVNLLPS